MMYLRDAVHFIPTNNFCNLPPTLGQRLQLVSRSVDESQVLEIANFTLRDGQNHQVLLSITGEFRRGIDVNPTTGFDDSSFLLKVQIRSDI